MPRKEVALEIEHFYNDEDVEFHILSKREMLSILLSIGTQGSRIALFYDRGRNFVLTTLLGANEHGMWLDVGPFSQENTQLLLGDKITFVSVHQNVKVQFEVRNIGSGLFESYEAFYVDMPDFLLRIQRREFFRTAIPDADFVSCIIPIQQENPDDPVIMRTLPIIDISGGGVGLMCEGHEATLLPEKTFPDCQISLPDVGILAATIEVRNSINLTTPNNVLHKRVGCRFIGLDNQMNILLQRYIAGLQSESIARRRHSLA